MIEDEVLSTPMDRRSVGNGAPGEIRPRSRPDGAPRRAALWSLFEAEAFEPSHDVFDADGAVRPPEAVWGAFPKGFARWAISTLLVKPTEVLHMCSGSLSAREVLGGLRVDIARRARPDVVADCRRLPFRDASFGGVLIDPPYSVEWARELYETEYPRPSHLIREASRVVRPGGLVGFLHFLVPNTRPLQFVRCYGVTQGCGYRIRAYTLMQRPQDGLFDAAAAGGSSSGRRARRRATTSPEGA